MSYACVVRLHYFPGERHHHMDTISFTFGFLGDLLAVWSPFVAAIALIATIAFFGAKVVHTAQINAQIRADRRHTFLAPVILLADRRRSSGHVA